MILHKSVSRLTVSRMRIEMQYEYAFGGLLNDSANPLSLQPSQFLHFSKLAMQVAET